MKILLIESPYKYLVDSANFVGKYFPLGLGYITSYLIKNGYNEVKIFVPQNKSNYFGDLENYLNEFLPDIVGISTMTPSYPMAVKICNFIKLNYKPIVTVVGGPHVTVLSEEILKDSNDIDYAVVGEGEKTFLELVQVLRSKSKNLKKINGLVWRDDKNSIICNKRRAYIKDINELPFPARHLVDISSYKTHSYITFGKKSATVITSRGCPFKCMFCSSWLNMGSRYRFRSVENIILEIKELVDQYHIDHIVFEDDTMTLNRQRVEKICNALISMPNRPSWYCLSRVDSMDRELASLMKKAGCKMVNFGIESGSEEILKKINKKITIEQTISAVQACQNVGLRTQCTFIVGFPYDTKKTMEMTLKAAIKISPTIAIFFPLTPYPGTQVYNDFLPYENRPKNSEEWKNFLMTNGANVFSVNKNFTRDDISKIANKWNLRFYLRPFQLWRMAMSIESVSEFYRLAIGAYYLAKSNLPLQSK